MEGLKPAIPVGGRELIALLTKDLVSSCPNFGMTLSITCLLFVKTLNHERSGEQSEDQTDSRVRDRSPTADPC